MKVIGSFLFLIAMINQGCTPMNNSTNHFTLSNDTLYIKTETHKGVGLFEQRVGSLEFEDVSKSISNEVVFPDNISNIKHAKRFIDIKVWSYNEYKESGKSKLSEYILDDINNNRIDTLNIPTRTQNFIHVMTGIRENENVFILDENNNRDFTDDPVRTIEKIDWETSDGLIKCEFNIYDGERVVVDSTWVAIGRPRENAELSLGVGEHLKADFYIDEDYFQIVVKDSYSGFPYDMPILALLSHNSKSKDSLLLKDNLYLNEYVKLNDDYYRFDRISNSGNYLTLIKERNFENKIGTQIGMIAPEFNSISVVGDTIRSSALHNRNTVIANSCGCGGDQVSTNAFSDISKKYGDKANILHLDSKIENGLEGIHIDMEEKYNEDIYNKYRKTYCSRICYVIDENNRIIDKFMITDWESFLPQIFVSLKAS